MTQLFQDAMAICRHFYKPDLFLTMTANPKWPEIIHSLFPAQTATNRPDIVSWVFKQKKKALLKLIDNGFFDTTIAHIHTIEFQKRGLPHIHLLIFLHSQHRIQDSHHKTQLNFLILNYSYFSTQKSPSICCMVYVVLTIPKPSVWSIENVVNAFLRSIEREQIGLRTVIYYMLGLTIAWFLNTMGPDSPINIWSLTVLNFSFSLIVILMLRSIRGHPETSQNTLDVSEGGILSKSDE